MLATIPGFIKWIYKKRIWEGPANDRAVYLTFDDGPIPEVTPWVLDQLRTYNARATFFCIGDNIQKHPGIFRQVVAEGHSVGNHTYNHLNGWKTSAAEYLLNTLKAQQVIDKNLQQKKPVKNPLFRPPYGKMSGKQAKQLRQRGFKVVMWSVLSMDYNSALSAENCTKNVLNAVRPGSIIVFHDSLKAQRNLEKILPAVLAHLSNGGYSFEALK